MLDEPPPDKPQVLVKTEIDTTSTTGYRVPSLPWLPQCSLLVHCVELLLNGGNAARFANGGIAKDLHTLEPALMNARERLRLRWLSV